MRTVTADWGYLINDPIFNSFTRAEIFWATNVSLNHFRRLSNVS
jgi:hypothetical protein